MVSKYPSIKLALFWFCRVHRSKTRTWWKEMYWPWFAFSEIQTKKDLKRCPSQSILRSYATRCRSPKTPMCWKNSKALWIRVDAVGSLCMATCDIRWSPPSDASVRWLSQSNLKKRTASLFLIIIIESGNFTKNHYRKSNSKVSWLLIRISR